MSIEKSEVPDDERYIDILNNLVRGGYLVENNDEYKLSKRGIMWAGDISQLFFADEEIAKSRKSVYYSLKNNTNPFNQDKMNIAKKYENRER